ncbi:MAG: sigma-70 family RNA polymerase sigma factor, partial [Solirubrobacterales bacterium]|nr:sigma-70 family RNA polymerase sigma factor [Solirubrobacterales bacterium]
VEDGLTITTAARQLPVHERRVLQLRFLEDLTQTQIAERIGVSQMQVSRILRRALARLNEFADPDGQLHAGSGTAAARRA